MDSHLHSDSKLRHNIPSRYGSRGQSSPRAQRLHVGGRAGLTFVASDNPIAMACSRSGYWHDISYSRLVSGSCP